MTPSVPDVWIRDFTPNTPGHRIVDPAPDPARGDTARHRIVCPPGEVFGGQVVTRKLAASLPSLPCTRCFGSPASGPPGPGCREERVSESRPAEQLDRNAAGEPS